MIWSESRWHWDDEHTFIHVYPVLGLAQYGIRFNKPPLWQHYSHGACCPDTISLSASPGAQHKVEWFTAATAERRPQRISHSWSRLPSDMQPSHNTAGFQLLSWPWPSSQRSSCRILGSDHTHTHTHTPNPFTKHTQISYVGNFWSALPVPQQLSTAQPPCSIYSGENTLFQG